MITEIKRTLKTIHRRGSDTSARQIALKVARKAWLWALLRTPPRNRLGDKFVACVLFWMAHHRLPTGRTRFNDVLFRLKTSDAIMNPLRTFVADKEFVKLYVRAVVGDHYNVPTLAIFKSTDEIDATSFPRKCCIKPTHASGAAIIRRMDEPVDRDRIKRWLSWNYYQTDRAVEYKYLEPKVIVEPLIYGKSNIEDYKIFCYRGVPKLIQVDIDRYIAHTRRFYDINWTDLDFSIIYPRSEVAVDRPENLEEMLRVAARLSDAFSFIRVDLYSDGETIYVGEITNCSEGANGNFIPPSAEDAISELVFGLEPGS